MATSDEAVRLFADLVQREDDAVSVPAASLAVAAAVYPELDVSAALTELRQICDAAPRLQDLEAGTDELDVLKHYFYEDLGFHGARNDYYDPRNSFLNEVLSRRCGIPITLAVLFIEVGRSMGLEIEGVGFPRHFLVRELHHGRIIDVFDGGKILSTADCRSFVKRQGIAEQWKSDFLASVGRRQMLARILNNLRRLYVDDGDADIRQALDRMTEVLRDLPKDAGLGLQ